jgi:single-strand DNA-binding protein
MINSVTLVGNLGAKPEIGKTEGGVSYIRFRMATSESYMDRSTGELTKKTEWHRIVVWRELAEKLATHLDKGSLVYLEGKISTSKFTGNDGIERYSTDITAYTVRNLTPRERNNQDSVNTDDYLLAQEEPATY